MRLIDLDSLIVEFKKRCRGECCCCTEDYCGSGNDGCGCRVIDEAPTVDAVEVVRCKDCKHKPTGSGVNHHITFPEQDYRCPCRCEDYWYSWMPEDDWFCANGERRKDGKID